MMAVSQIVILHTLNLNSAVCQLYLNKSGRKNKIDLDGSKTKLQNKIWNFKDVKNSGISKQIIWGDVIP